MFKKPDNRVYVIFRNVHDGKSRCLTVLGTDCEELKARFTEFLQTIEDQTRRREPRRKVV